MTERKAVTRAELADDEVATVLAEALAGRHLSRRAANSSPPRSDGSPGRYHPAQATWQAFRAALTPPQTCSTLRLLDQIDAAPERRSPC
jgi:hypothetical protein